MAVIALVASLVSLIANAWLLRLLLELSNKVDEDSKRLTSLDRDLRG
jgi:hypothetical protein